MNSDFMYVVVKNHGNGVRDLLCVTDSKEIAESLLTNFTIEIFEMVIDKPYYNGTPKSWGLI